MLAHHFEVLSSEGMPVGHPVAVTLLLLWLRLRARRLEAADAEQRLQGYRPASPAALCSDENLGLGQAEVRLLGPRKPGLCSQKPARSSRAVNCLAAHGVHHHAYGVQRTLVAAAAATWGGGRTRAC